MFCRQYCGLFVDINYNEIGQQAALHARSA